MSTQPGSSGSWGANRMVAPPAAPAAPIHPAAAAAPPPRPTGVSADQQTATGGDPFRSRRGPSSRAPSKHVDEYEAVAAHQARQQTESSTAVAAHETGAANSDLAQIPEWNEFVTSGSKRGLDVLSILEVCTKARAADVAGANEAQEWNDNRSIGFYLPCFLIFTTNNKNCRMTEQLDFVFY